MIMEYVTLKNPFFELVIFLLCVAIVNGLPDPESNSKKFYKWFYRSSHLFLSVGTHFFASERAWKMLEPVASLEPEVTIVKNGIPNGEGKKP